MSIWAGAETLRSRTSAKPLRLYGSWRCPYSQRVWISLEEKAVEFQFLEVDLYGTGGSSSSSLGTSGARRQRVPLEALMQSYPDFISCSPQGELPALDDSGCCLPGTRVLLEYVHEAFDGPPLLPKTPFLRAQVRHWAAHVDEGIVPHYDRLLTAREDGERAAARSSLLDGLETFAAAMAPAKEGPFFLGDDFTIADIALAPWWQRMVSVLRAYRKFDPSVSSRLQTWYEAVETRPAFRRTAMDPERLIEDAAEFAEVSGAAMDCARPSSEPQLATAQFRRAPRGARHAHRFR